VDQGDASPLIEVALDGRNFCVIGPGEGVTVGRHKGADLVIPDEVVSRNALRLLYCNHVGDPEDDHLLVTTRATHGAWWRTWELPADQPLQQRKAATAMLLRDLDDFVLVLRGVVRPRWVIEVSKAPTDETRRRVRNAPLSSGITDSDTLGPPRPRPALLRTLIALCRPWPQSGRAATDPEIGAELGRKAGSVANSIATLFDFCSENGLVVERDRNHLAKMALDWRLVTAADLARPVGG